VSTAGVQYAGLVSNDAFSVAATGNFDSKNVGTAKTVTLSSTYSGADVGNYAVTDQTSTTASVTAKALTVSGITAANKVYDGNAVATVSTAGVQYAGLVSNDAFSVAATGNFDSKNVGTAKTVTLSSTYSGADVGNYAVTDQTSTTANVTAKALTMTGHAAQDKTFDGLNTAQTSLGNLNGLVGSETLLVSGSGTFDDANVGVGKTVTIALALADGSGLASNYTVTNPTTTATIKAQPAPVPTPEPPVPTSPKPPADVPTPDPTPTPPSDPTGTPGPTTGIPGGPGGIPGDPTGTPAPGGDPTTGGTPAPGGDPTTGGTPAPGGDPTTGGTPAPGGDPTTGGTPAPGGDPTTGGTPAPGGDPTTGGTPAPGGDPTTGGTPAPGGDPTTGGTPAPGGDPTTGGTPLAVSLNVAGDVPVQTVASTTGESTTGVVGSGGSTGFISVRAFGSTTVPVDSVFSFTLPKDTFKHADPKVTLVLEARLPNGRVLPDWLKFDSARGRFTGRAPKDVREITVRVVARDNRGNEAFTTIVLRFEAPNGVAK
jgi:hypothetical protein